ISFYIGAAAFLLSVLWTVFTTKEYPPEILKKYHTTKPVPEHETSGLRQALVDILNIPVTMKQLAFVQFFSWFALFSMWIYTTAAVTRHIFGTSDVTSALYNQGADWIGILFAAYNGFAAIMAFLLPPLAKMTSRKTVHMISLIAGGLGLISFFFIKDYQLLLISMLGIGLAWASILSMPYAILAGALPANKMGFYMGVFNFFIVIPQILAAGILGYITLHLFNGEAIYALMLGGFSFFIAAVLVMMVKDVDESKAEV
ncbi:MAG: MFS transporter, partial [Bacteroidota bacterium]|nr:MFS transporter [Bacteroidota bacterium]